MFLTKNNEKQIYKLSTIILFMMLLMVAPVKVYGANVVTYDYKDTIFGQRTEKDIAAEYSKAKNAGETYVDGNSSTYYTVPASIEAPYNQGVLTDDTLASMEAMTNFYRYLTGAQPLKEKCVQNESLQYQALDRNFQFDHFISNNSKPEDMDDELWEKGFKLDHNILALYSTPWGSITSWMNEGYRPSIGAWDTVGHRMALITPTYSSVQFGYSGYVAIGKICERKNDNYSEPFSAFPAAGYMPNNLIDPSECVWSTYLNTQKIKVADADKVAVTVKNLTTGESYTCSKDNSKLQTGSSYINFVQPTDISDTKYVDRYTDTYSVTVTGLQDVETGNDAQIKYEVKFFDVSQLAESYVDTVTPEGFSNLVIYKTMDGTENLQKIATTLPKQVKIVADSGYETTISVKGNWVLDEKNKCFTNKADPEQLPSNISDKNGKLDNIKVSYEITDGYYESFNSIGKVGSPTEGSTIQIYVYRTMMSSTHSKIFKLNKNKNGVYEGTEIFDRYTSKEFDEEKSSQSKYPYDYYNFGPLKISDSGEYISIYYSDGKYDDTAYVSVGTLNISVIPKETTGSTTNKPTTGSVTGNTTNKPTTGPVTDITIDNSDATGDETATTDGSDRTTDRITTDSTENKINNTQKKLKATRISGRIYKKIQSKKIKLTFKKVAGAKKYTIQISTNKKFSKVLYRKNVKTTKATLSSNRLKNRKKLYVRVKAVGAVKWSKAVRVIVKVPRQKN